MSACAMILRSSRTSGPTMTLAPDCARRLECAEHAVLGVRNDRRRSCVRRPRRRDESRAHRFRRARIGGDVRAAVRGRCRPMASAGRTRDGRSSASGGVACRGCLRSGECGGHRQRQRMRATWPAAARAAVRQCGQGREHGNGACVMVAGGESGQAREGEHTTMSWPSVSRAAGNIICGGDAARKSARPDAARARRAGDRRASSPRRTRA